MICTLTLNPALDITYVLEKVDFGDPERALEVIKTPGGKGINVSRALEGLGVESITMGLVGGFVGEEVLALVQDAGLRPRGIKIRNETRANVIILGKNDGRELAIRAEGPLVERAETNRLIWILLEETQECEFMVLSGSLPLGVSDNIYYSLIEVGKESNIKFILDTSGTPLRKGIEAGPYLIKPNLQELRNLAGEELADDESIIEFGMELSAKGIEVVVVSLGGDGAIMISGDEAWRGRVPFIPGDTVGAGDSMVAGMVMGLVERESLESVFRRGLACGFSAVANSGPGLCEPDTYRRGLEEASVERIR